MFIVLVMYNFGLATKLLWTPTMWSIPLEKFILLISSTYIIHTYVVCTLRTLYNVILRIARNFLETRENIKISTHPFYHINLDWFLWEWSKKIIFFLKKKIQNGRLKKTEFFKIANSQNCFKKISQIFPWVSRPHQCKGHWCDSTYMAMRLSDISSKTG
jgi:hypothetical protein